jgi:hypothetical protein
LGILAACAEGGGGGGGGGNSGVNFNQNFSNFPNREMEQFVRWLEQNSGALVAIAIGLVCVILLINIIIWVLGLIGRGGLIGGARLAQASGQATFAQGWGEGTRNFGRLFSLWLITELPLIIVGLIIAAIVLVVVFQTLVTASSDVTPEVILAPFFGLLACIVPVACVLALAGIVLRILNHMGTLAAVSEEIAGMAALRRGWEVLRNNALSLIILGVILWVINLVIGIVSALPLILVVVPVFFSVAVSAAANDPNLIGGGVIFALVCCALYFPVLLVISGILQTWSWSAWALAYDKVSRPGLPSAVESPPAAPSPLSA